MSKQSVFSFKQFKVHQSHAIMKVNTDSIMLGSWLDLYEDRSVLDIGTGTGVLSLMLAQKAKRKLTIDAVEIDNKSCKDAALNFESFNTDAVLTLYNQSIQSYSEEHTNLRYDLIISNPPFFSGGTLSYNEDRNIVRQTTKLSHAELLRIVISFLDDNGRFALILPYIEGLRFIEMAEMYHLYLRAKCSIKSTPKCRAHRLILVFGKFSLDHIEEDNLSIYNLESNYSKEYIALTKDYYAHDLSLSKA